MAVLLEVFESPVVRHQTEGKQFVTNIFDDSALDFAGGLGSVCLFQLVRGDVYLVEGLVSAVGQQKENVEKHTQNKVSEMPHFPDNVRLHSPACARTHTHNGGIQRCSRSSVNVDPPW